MAELGSGNGSDYPGTLDTDTTKEVDSPNAGKTLARAAVPNDLAAAIVAIETELGTDPAGTLTDVKTFLQVEHDTDGTHGAITPTSLSVSGASTLTGAVTASAIVKTAKGADVASAASLTLGTDGNSFDITGTTAITSIGTIQVGTIVILEFDAALTLTHHATDLILPGAANITTAAGDIAMLYEYATGDWRCINYQYADGEDTTELSINWASAGGISQMMKEKISDSVTTDATYQTVTQDTADRNYAIRVYVPDNANSLEYTAYLKRTAGGGGGGHIRLTDGSTNGTATGSIAGTAGWTTVGTITVSGMTAGWNILYAQLQGDVGYGDTMDIRQLSYRFL